MRSVSVLAVVLALATAGCSLTPIPDLSSEWLDPCDVAQRRCEHTFTLPAHAETSVEVRGTWRVDGWTRGDALTKAGTSWTATVALPWATEVQYKFFVDGKTWVLDPTNPKTAPDGKGNTNNVLAPFTCEKWTCVQ